MVITVTCPACASTFPVDPAKIPEGGVNARCTQCNHIFRVEKPADEAPVADLPEIKPVAEDPGAGFSAPLPEIESAPATVSSDLDEAGSFAPPPPLPGVSEPATGAAEAPAAEEPSVDLPPLPEISTEQETTEVSFDSDGPATFEAPGEVTVDSDPPATHEAPASEPGATPDFSHAPAGSDPFAEPAPFEGAAPAQPPAAPAEPAPPPAEEQPVQGFTFGKRDPTDKAKRLARVLVSDMIMYNAERHQTALAQGTLVQDFEEEIQKSWKEYVEQVGEELANGEGRTFWVAALNDILAKGQDVF